MEDENDLRGYIVVLWRRKTLIAGIAVLACLLGVATDVWQRARPRVQASIVIQPAKNTNGAYSNSDGIVALLRIRGVVDLFLDRAGVPVSLVDSPRPLVSVRVDKIPNYGGLIVVSAVAPADSLAEAKRVAQALTAGIVDEGRKEAANRHEILKQALDAINSSASTFYNLGRQAVSRGGAEPSGVLQGITLGNQLSGMQGLFAGAFQAERDVRLQMIEVQPPRVLSSIGVSKPPSVPFVQLILMSVIVGVAVGVVFALVAEYAIRSRAPLAGGPVRHGVDLPQHGG